MVRTTHIEQGSGMGNGVFVQTIQNFQSKDSIHFDATTAPIPEPSTILLFGTGLVGLIGYRWKKAQA